MAEHDLRVILTNLVKQRGARKKNADPYDMLLNENTQGYVMSPEIILKEIKRPESPFSIDVNGKKFTEEGLSSVAREISLDMYTEYKTFIQKWPSYNVSGSRNFPSDFFDTGKITTAYDDVNRIIYYRAKRGQNTATNHYKSFTGGVKNPVEAIINARADKKNNTRIYVCKSGDTLLDAWKLLAVGWKEEFEYQGRSDDGVENAVRREKNKYFERAGADKGDSWDGLQAGHIFGAKVFGASHLLANRHNVEDQDLDNLEISAIIPPALHPRLQIVIKQLVLYDADLEWKRLVTERGVEGVVTFTIPESAVNNAKSGGITGKYAQDNFDSIVDYLRTVIPDTPGSPSFNQLVTELIENIFLEKRTGKKSYNTKVSTSFKRSTQVPVVSMGSKGVKVSKEKKTKPKRYSTGQGLLKRVLNPLLHDAIRDNMGKGKAEQILNYRTGRFARSARIVGDIIAKGSTQLKLIVKYQRDPYRVFERGGHLYKPGRDPAVIFGKSIKQLLREQKIANLSRVEVELRG